MSLDVVKAARAKYAHLEGEERAYCIVNEVAWQLRYDGTSLPDQAGQAGTFYKPGGTNYKERSLDVIIYKPGGETYDILKDAEGIAKPQWTRTEPTGHGDVSKWRAAVPPIIIAPPTPEPEPEPEPPSDDYITRDEFTAYQRQVEQQLAVIRSQLHALETRVAVLEAVEAGPSAPVYMLVPDDTATPIRTSRDFGHAHEFRAAVVPKV